MKSIVWTLILAGSFLNARLIAQKNAPETDNSQTTLRVSSRAVLVDVLVSDRNGQPVTGLKQDAFAVTEQGKPQTIEFFEEHTGASRPASVEMPKLPPNVFTNFSPFPAPPAVNVLLLDSLNTRMENQSYVHEQARKFLRSAKTGSRMAIFTMGLGFHFVQGFTDDPALLMAALENKKNNEVEPSVMIKGQDESNAQNTLIGMMSQVDPNGGVSLASPEAIAALKTFFQSNDDFRSQDRIFLTLENLRRLATFLNSFPGRKNVIWFSESIPLTDANMDNPKIEDEYKRTMALLASARVALYPVDARGTSTTPMFSAETQLDPSIGNASQMLSTQNSKLVADSKQRNGDQIDMQRIAENSGGKAFANVNDLSRVMGDITASSSHFYTLSYTPANSKMDGRYRNIEVKVSGGKYSLSYRRGYIATDADLPGGAEQVRDQAIKKLNAQNRGAIDPLFPFMDLGMPQSQQILYKALIQEQPLKDSTAKPAWTAQKVQKLYSIDFAIDLKDIYLRLDPDGIRRGNLNISLIAYDRYGNIASRADHLVGLNIKPDVYTFFENAGVQLQYEIGVPKGELWLRTGIYDQATHKVGTMETPLTLVKSQPLAAH